MICLSGPDGSGKSTLAKLLRSYLLSHGIHAHILWFRGSHLFASLLARLLSRFAPFRGRDNPYYGITVPPKLRFVWSLIEFSSILPYYLLRRFLALFHYVIGDRCLLDFVVWIIVTLDYPEFLTGFLGRFLVRLVSKDVFAYVVADPAALRRRAPNTPYRFLLKEKACYDVLAKHYAGHLIDTTDRTPKEALGELLKRLRGL